jgi:hypothetical protein
MTTAEIHVRSHVSRDLLQAAAMFKNERLAVWEYVANGLQYVAPGVSPVVRVRLDSKGKKITISDNGRGMDWEGLRNFFVMHGENVDRKHGKGGRGRFGTGKSAAFGVADTLRLTTVSAGKKSVVELRRADLDAATEGDPVPVTPVEREARVDHPDGTVVEIEGVHLKGLDQAGVVKYIERHLARWPKGATVIVNNHQCEYLEPPVERIETVDVPAEFRDVLGETKLILKISKTPLDEDLRGVSIFGSGVWHETTLVGSAGREMAEFIFGEIDVPTLDEDESMPPAFDASRSMKLNPDNPLVQALYAFIGPVIESARKQLVEQNREFKASEEAKRLAEEASKIESIINNDFDAFRQKLQKVRAATAGAGFDVSEEETDRGGAGTDDFLYGGEEPATITSEAGEVGLEDQGGTSEGGPPRRLNPVVEPDTEGTSTGHVESKGNAKPRRRGGFSIEFDNLGVESARAEYVSERRTIYVNLEHPQIDAAKRNRGIEDPVFKRLAYEVAFSEYAVALAVELESRGEYFDPSDPIVDIRETLNRVARQAAELYA